MHAGLHPLHQLYAAPPTHVATPPAPVLAPPPTHVVMPSKPVTQMPPQRAAPPAVAFNMGDAGAYAAPPQAYPGYTSYPGYAEPPGRGYEAPAMRGYENAPYAMSFGGDVGARATSANSLSSNVANTVQSITSRFKLWSMNTY